MLHNRLLTYIDEVARLGSIRAASRKLNVASSAINRQIIALETDLGTPMFERLPRGLRLTAAGEILVGHVRETLRGHDRMTERINDMTGLRWGRITVATIGTVAAEVLPGVVNAFRTRYPRSSVDVRLVTDVLGQVEADEVDIGIGFEIPARAGIETMFEIAVALGAVMAPDHPLAQAATLTLATCVGYPLILPNEAMSTRPMLDQALRAYAEGLRTSLVSNSVELMKKSAQHGQGIAFLTLLNVAQECGRGELVHVPLTDRHMRPLKLRCICKTQRQIGPLTRPFITACEEHLAGMLRALCPSAVPLA